AAVCCRRSLAAQAARAAGASSSGRRGSLAADAAQATPAARKVDARSARLEARRTFDWEGGWLPGGDYGVRG
ncbi:MAG: hypothetical protein M3282_05440, partial [Gemmatimonadota bacterium]|nr:hypothetical protein [Gemmatimonadota bacterium]